VKAQLKPIIVPSLPVVTEMFDVSLMSYFQTPASELKVTNLDEVHEAIMGHKVGRAPNPNAILNRAFKHLPQRAVFPLVWIINAIPGTNNVEARPSYLHL
jgi:hypothetical protein